MAVEALTWVVYRTVKHRALWVLRLRAVGRWCSPPILCTSIESVRRNKPVGAALLRFT